MTFAYVLDHQWQRAAPRRTSAATTVEGKGEEQLVEADGATGGGGGASYSVMPFVAIDKVSRKHFCSSLFLDNTSKMFFFLLALFLLFLLLSEEDEFNNNLSRLFLRSSHCCRWYKSVRRRKRRDSGVVWKTNPKGLEDEGESAAAAEEEPESPQRRTLANLRY